LYPWATSSASISGGRSKTRDAAFLIGFFLDAFLPSASLFSLLLFLLSLAPASAIAASNSSSDASRAA
jgi:hypothetical protein